MYRNLNNTASFSNLTHIVITTERAMDREAVVSQHPERSSSNQNLITMYGTE
jgi:hypothetical protein